MRKIQPWRARGTRTDVPSAYTSSTGSYLRTDLVRVLCDVPAHNYTYSFKPKPDWSRVYAPAEGETKQTESLAMDMVISNNAGVHLLRLFSSLGIQIVPTIQPLAKDLTILVRSPTWIAPPAGMMQKQYTKEEKDEFATSPS